MIVEDDEKLRRFNSDWDTAHTTDINKQPQNGQVVPADDPQNLMDSIKMTPMTPYTPAVIPTTGNQCPECNLLHPPVPPGQTCPNAVAAQAPVQETIQTLPDDAVEDLVEERPKPLTEGPIRDQVRDPSTSPTRPIGPPPAPKPAVPVQLEPAPLAENNIPTDIHINKYLNSWGDMIRAHSQRRGTTNIKKLMRHLTIEITEFLENYEGR